MGLPNVGTQLRGSGKNQSVWKLEWTYTGTGGEVLLDDLQSDHDPRIETPVADSGTTGLTSVSFPKCDRAWVLGKNFEVAAADQTDPTDYRLMDVQSVDTDAGTLTVAFSEIETAGALADPNTGARVTLILLLEYT